MKTGKTLRKVVCRKCRKQIGWLPDLVVESDWDGFVGGAIYCIDHGVVKNDLENI